MRSGVSEEEDEDEDEDEEVVDVDVEPVLFPLSTSIAGDIAETLLVGTVAVVLVPPDPEPQSPSTASAGPYCNALHPGSAARTPLTCSFIGEVSLHE